MTRQPGAAERSEANQWIDRIHVGDCVRLLRAWQDRLRVDLVFADPPYNIGYRYDLYNDARPDEEYLDWLRQWIAACAAVLARHGSFWIAIGDEYAAEVKWIATREIGLHLRNWVVWYYTFGVHCQSKFTRSHTHLLHFVKDPERALFRADAVRVPSARRLVYNDLRADPKGRVPDNTWILRPQQVPAAFQPVENTWYIARVAGTFSERAGFHGCQLPERLVARAVLACTEEGQVVLDPFAGSGTTLAVAKKLGRHWVGIELSPHYAEHAQARVDAVRCGDPLEGPDEGILPVQRRGATVVPRVERRAAEAVERQVLEGYASEALAELLVDPTRSVEFLERCRRAALPGRPFDWNMALLRRVLSQHVPFEELVQVVASPAFFAADLAAAQVLNQGYPSLEYLLCDPRTTVLYEQLAYRLAPGVPSVTFRRAVLALLWAGRRARVQEGGETVSWSEPRELEAAEQGRIGKGPALYALLSQNKRRGAVLWYIGYCTDLGDQCRQLGRLHRLLLAVAPIPGTIMFRYAPLRHTVPASHWASLVRALKAARPPLSAVAKVVASTDTGAAETASVSSPL